jgi:hypothetical protein
VRHCYALIALWDGKPPAKPSGTAKMVACKLEGKASALYLRRKPLLLGAENGPIFIVGTPRLESGENAASVENESKAGDAGCGSPESSANISRSLWLARCSR